MLLCTYYINNVAGVLNEITNTSSSLPSPLDISYIPDMFNISSIMSEPSADIRYILLPCFLECVNNNHCTSMDFNIPSNTELFKITIMVKNLGNKLLCNDCYPHGFKDYKTFKLNSYQPVDCIHSSLEKCFSLNRLSSDDEPSDDEPLDTEEKPSSSDISILIHNIIKYMLNKNVLWYYLPDVYKPYILDWLSWVKKALGIDHNTVMVVVAKQNRNSNTVFKMWLSGLIDAQGHFDCSKKDYTSLKIIMDVKDKAALDEIKDKYGGSIKAMAGSNSLKYKLLNTTGLIKLINDVNGLILNPVRMLQLNKICKKYNIGLKQPNTLLFNIGWFSGFVDGDGSVDIDKKNDLMSISVTQRNRCLLDPLIDLYGGIITVIKYKGDVFKYSVYKKEEVLNLVRYFGYFPLRTCKAKKINLIKDYYKLRTPLLLRRRSDLNINNLDIYNEPLIFKNKWDNI